MVLHFFASLFFLFWLICHLICFNFIMLNIYYLIWGSNNGNGLPFPAELRLLGHYLDECWRALFSQGGAAGWREEARDGSRFPVLYSRSSCGNGILRGRQNEILNHKSFH